MSETADLATRAAQKLAAGNAVVAPQPQVTPAQPAPEEGGAEAPAQEEAPAPKKHHKSKKLQEQKDEEAPAGGSGDKDLDDTRGALSAAKK